MAGLDTINLIAGEAVVPDHVRRMERTLKSLSILSLIAVVIFGVATIVFYSVVTIQNKALMSRKERLMSELSALSRIESMYLVLKSRIGYTKTIIETTRDVGAIVERVYDLNPPPLLSGVTFLMSGAVTMNYQTGDINHIIPLVSTYEELTRSNEFKKTRMNSFSVSDKGYAVQLEYKL